MLTQIWQSEPVTFLQRSQYFGGYGFNIDYHPELAEPYVQGLYGLGGLLILNRPTRTSPHRVLLYTVLSTRYWPGWDYARYEIDSVTGSILERTNDNGQPFYQQVAQSRLRRMYWITAGGFSLRQFQFDEDFETTVNQYRYTDFEGSRPFRHTHIDEVQNRLINFSTRFILVHDLTTGEQQYSLEMPGQVVASCLEDANRLYVMCVNRILVLVDYVRGEILGAVRFPPPISEGTQAGFAEPPQGLMMAWDYLYRRLLVCENTPSNPDGSGTTHVRGYRMVPVQTRLTKPIPIRVPRLGQTVPHVVQIVGDLNEGVGGSIIQATVTGDGELAGLPITDHQGKALVYVEVGAADSDGIHYIDTGQYQLDVLADDPPPIAVPVSGEINPNPVGIPDDTTSGGGGGLDPEGGDGSAGGSGSGDTGSSNGNTPPAGASTIDTSGWSDNDWRDWFFAQLGPYPRVTLAALQALRPAVNARGGDFQNGWRGDLRPRLFLPNPPYAPAYLSSAPPQSYARYHDLGQWGGAWEWI